MNDGKTWSAMAVVTYAAWAMVFALIGGMWVAVGIGHPGTAQVLGFTGCSTSAVAAVLQIRRYTCRVMAMIRALHGPDEIAATGLRPLR